MKLLTKNTDYALRALLHVAAHPGEFVSAAVIARNEDIPVPFLKGIVRKLIKGSYLEAKEGAGGGVKLMRDPADTALIDIMRLFQGDFQLSECMFRRRPCPNRARCVLRSRIKGIEDTVLAEFERISLADLVNDAKSRK